jgi:hypothetical protein
VAIIDDLMKAREATQQTNTPPVAPASNWVKDLVDKRYEAKTERLKRQPIGFNFTREPFDPSSFYTALNMQKGINSAATNVVRQEVANREQKEAEREAAENQRRIMEGIGAVDPRFTYDDGGYTGGGVSRKYGLKGVSSNVAKAADFWGSKYGIKNVGGYREHGSVPGSDHPKGRALDFMTYKNKKQGTALANDLIKNYKAWNIKYVIWNRYIWSPGRGWRKYNGPSPHTDHVHASFNK